MVLAVDLAVGRHEYPAVLILQEIQLFYLKRCHSVGL